VKSVSPETKVIGVEPEGAPSMTLALKERQPKEVPSIDRFVDGAAVKKVESLPIIYAARIWMICYWFLKGKFALPFYSYIIRMQL
jgi:threonine dehydratase